jgi:hypothetical protein
MSSKSARKEKQLRKVLLRLLRQSPAMVVAMLALFVALTGTAVATTSALITGNQIRNSSITGLDVKNKSLTPRDFRGSVRGPRGLRGLTGATGAKGDKGDKGDPGAPNPNAANSDLLDNLDSTEFIPTFVQATGGGGAVDIDTEPVLCQTPPYTPTSPRVARIDSWVSGNQSAGALLGFFGRNVYGTNGGAVTNNLDAAAVSRAGSTAANEWAHLTNSATLELTPGTTYVFGIQVGRTAGVGTTDLSDNRCEVMVFISRR